MSTLLTFIPPHTNSPQSENESTNEAKDITGTSETWRIRVLNTFVDYYKRIFRV